MARHVIKASVPLTAVCCFAALLSGCGGDSMTTTYSVPAQRVSGTVSLPDGSTARAETTLLRRLVRLAGGEAFALTGTVKAAPANVEVRLILLDGHGAQQRQVRSTLTDGHGQFVIPLPDRPGVATCPFMLV